jgi:hypothetical protein
MTLSFRSRVDGKFKWLALMLPGAALVALFASPSGGRLVWIPAASMFLVAVLVCWILFATYYEIQSGYLVAHSGPFTWRVALGEITAIHESASVRSGPALSMDRLEVVYRGGRVLIISPADKVGFLAAIRRHTPQLGA